MSLRVTEDASDALSSDLEPQQAEFESGSAAQRFDYWLRDHLNGVALVVIAAGLGLRFYMASRNYLNPDEALHYLLINQGSVWLAYKASLTNAHPPLFYLILYYWHFLGRSELMLRMPSVIAGAGFCWLAFRWLAKIFGAAASLIGVVFLAFSPAIVVLSVEVRAYSVMLLCVAGALYFLARAFEEKSVPRMWCFSIFLYLAIFSHYSVLFFTIALGVYALARILDSQLPRKVALAWALGQVGALAEYGFLYVTHVSKVRKAIPIWGSEFFGSYYQWAEGDILAFTWRKTLSIFDYLFALQHLSFAMLMLFLAGVSLILARDFLGRQKDTPMNRMGLLLLLPFASIWGASLAGVYPYVGTRHTVVLAPFAIAGVCYVLAAVSRQRLWAGLLIGVALTTYANFSDKVGGAHFSEGDHSPAEMASAMDYMKLSIPKGDHILVDFQSFLAIAYYYCAPNVVVPVETFSKEYFRASCNGNPIISLHNWKLSARYFPGQFEKMARDNGLRSGDRVWVYQTGWGGTLDAELPASDSRFRCLAPNPFGGGVAVIPFVVGPDFKPAVLPGSCSGLTGQRPS